MFSCVHFGFANHRGGLWSYIIFAVLFLVGLLKYKNTFSFTSVPRIINILLLIMVVHQFLGLLLNPYSFVSNIQSFVITCSQCLVLYTCASSFLSAERFKNFMTIWFLTAAWIFITVLNQYNQWLFTNSPLLPITEARLTIFTNFPTGTFGSTELLAEYFCLVFIISIIITIYHETFEQLRIKMIYPLIMIFFALMSLIMTASRSAIILAMVAMLYIIINNTMLSSTRQKIRKNSLLVGHCFLNHYLSF